MKSQLRLALIITCCAVLDATAVTQDWEAADRATRRLAPAAFPQLPSSIRDALVKRGCTIPQPYDARSPENVIKGSFIRAGQTDWAVLCSQQRISAVLVFPADNPAAVMTMPGAADLDFLQGVGNGAIGFSRAITVATPKQMRQYAADDQSQKKLPAFRHDGIEDAFIGKASGVLYWDGTRWLSLRGAD